MSLLCAQSDALFYEFRVHLPDLKQARQRRGVNVLARAARVFSAAAGLSLQNTLRRSLHSSRSSAERDRCLSENYFNIFNTVTFILSQNFYQNFVLISKKTSSLFTSSKRKHYVITVASWLI